MQNKQYFRDRVSAAFNAVSNSELHALSIRVIANLNTIEVYTAANTILFYYPLPDELPILPAAAAALQAGKTVLFPVCGPDHTIVCRQVTDLAAGFSPGTYGIPEPLADSHEAEPGSIDCILTPGRAFDRNGNRVGRGAGYYDRFFRLAPAASIAPLLSFQVYDKVPVAAEDIPVDWLVTEEEIIRCTAE